MELHSEIIFVAGIIIISKWTPPEEEFEDTKGLIRIRISKKNRQHNGQKKINKGQTTIYKTYI
jgi:hypothetical protein